MFVQTSQKLIEKKDILHISFRKRQTVIVKIQRQMYGLTFRLHANTFQQICIEIGSIEMKKSGNY